VQFITVESPASQTLIFLFGSEVASLPVEPSGPAAVSGETLSLRLSSPASGVFGTVLALLAPVALPPAPEVLVLVPPDAVEPPVLVLPPLAPARLLFKPAVPPALELALLDPACPPELPACPVEPPSFPLAPPLPAVETTALETLLAVLPPVPD
jgi:hypothetical protein